MGAADIGGPHCARRYSHNREIHPPLPLSYHPLILPLAAADGYALFMRAYGMLQPAPTMILIVPQDRGFHPILCPINGAFSYLGH